MCQPWKKVAPFFHMAILGIYVTVVEKYMMYMAQSLHIGLVLDPLPTYFLAFVPSIFDLIKVDIWVENISFLFLLSMPGPCSEKSYCVRVHSVVWTRHEKNGPTSKTTWMKWGVPSFRTQKFWYLRTSFQYHLVTNPEVWKHHFTWDLVSDSRKVAVQMKLDLRFATIYTGHFLQKIEGLLKTTFQAWISGVFFPIFFGSRTSGIPQNRGFRDAFLRGYGYNYDTYSSSVQAVNSVDPGTEGVQQ